MRVVLGCCATSSNHDFSNFASYRDYVDYSYILDSGLTYDERQKIEQQLSNSEFIDYKFTGNFSHMRNTLIQYVEQNETVLPCFIIMPDESWKLKKFDKSELEFGYKNGYRQFVAKVSDSISDYYCCKIFTSDCKFQGTVRERLKDGKKMLISAQFEDICLDKARSYDLSRKCNDPFYLADWYKQNGNLSKAIELYEKFVDNTRNDAEQRFLAHIQLSALKKDINHLRYAVMCFEPRAREALYLAFAVTGDKQYLKQASQYEWGCYFHQMPKGLKEEIDNTIQKHFPDN